MSDVMDDFFGFITEANNGTLETSVSAERDNPNSNPNSLIRQAAQKSKGRGRTQVSTTNLGSGQTSTRTTSLGLFRDLEDDGVGINV